MMTPQERAQSLIERNDHMIIASADEAGNPWVSPVFYVPDDDWDLYWVSARTARHSANIGTRPQIAIVIYETEPRVDAVYITARATEVNDPDEAGRAAQVLARKRQPDRWVIHDVKDVIGTGPWRIYRATALTIETRAETMEGGKAVAVREPADFRAQG